MPNPAARAAANAEGAPLLEVKDLKVWFPIKKGRCAAPWTM
jgi:microcin C transport system ATP-binding protein